MADLSALRRQAADLAPLMLARLEELVRHESPPGSLPDLKACADLLDEWFSKVLGRRAQRVSVDGLPHLLWPAATQDVLLLGHYDTVWPAGTINDWPFVVNGAVATGPGVCDMKAGIVQMLTALSLLPDTSRVGVLLTADEETGSVTSRPLIEREAARSGAVLVCEPSTEHGELKVARKGGSVYRIHVRGRAAHAGVEPERGVNATIELAHQVLNLRRLAAGGTSVTPTLASAGVMTNQVPEQATLCVDVRAWTRTELERVDTLIHGLRARLPGARLVIDGGVNRYPLLIETARPLMELATKIAFDLGLARVTGTASAGASDANFTGALGVPTLDGLGGVGGGSHARSEYVNVWQMPDRAALLAELIRRIVETDPALRRASQWV